MKVDITDLGFFARLGEARFGAGLRVGGMCAVCVIQYYMLRMREAVVFW